MGSENFPQIGRVKQRMYSHKDGGSILGTRNSEYKGPDTVQMWLLLFFETRMEKRRHKVWQHEKSWEGHRAGCGGILGPVTDSDLCT